MIYQVPAIIVLYGPKWFIYNRCHKPVEGKTLQVKPMCTVSSGPLDGTCEGIAPPEKNASGIAPRATFATNEPMHGQLPVSENYYQVSNCMIVGIALRIEPYRRALELYLQ